jgi:hypothetical protein
MTKFYLFQLIWSILIGAFKYFVTTFSTDGIIGQNGHINDLWNIGALINIIDVLVVNILCLMETRSFTTLLILSYIAGLILLPITIIAN